LLRERKEKAALRDELNVTKVMLKVAQDQIKPKDEPEPKAGPAAMSQEPTSNGADAPAS